ncbi:RSP_2648 family PIN domain-containing protein [Jannaschia sp. W003]|uniref:RSP_2648 family PIN domain-containing protein n=1 Tax=Jannaschia sp. W003 TaxID=2867012 RepID=UPI0021A96513|nr:PIN domain-containing protein [Jannaschia sp. W003]UWQ20841.1 PIN domain-containing protein [Jannaschia sp. W003]
MKVLLDACVLFPTVLRELLLGAASEGLYEPLWSDRILEEWARATPKLGPGAEAQARGEIALLRRDWPRASIQPKPGTEARLWLPDPNDVHVLAAAIDGHADVLVTFNRRDFPKGEVAGEGIALRDPDGFLVDLWLRAPEAVERVAGRVHVQAGAMGHPMEMRALMKRARLPKLGKALAG